MLVAGSAGWWVYLLAMLLAEVLVRHLPAPLPYFQLGLMLALETLVRLDVPVERAMQRIRGIRASRYASLREFYAQKNGDTPEL